TSIGSPAYLVPHPSPGRSRSVIPSVQRGTWAGGATRRVPRAATRAPGPSPTLRHPERSARDLGGRGYEARASCRHPSSVIPSVQRGTWAGGATRRVPRAATRAPGPSLTLGMTSLQFEIHGDGVIDVDRLAREGCRTEAPAADGAAGGLAEAVGEIANDLDVVDRAVAAHDTAHDDRSGNAGASRGGGIGGDAFQRRQRADRFVARESPLALGRALEIRALGPSR